MNVHFSSKTDLWSTPQDFYDKLNAEFGFTLDVCSTDENTKCERYFTEETDGLSQDWTGVCWMNPPYGRVIGKWMKKAYEASLQGATVVCLVPARTDTKWWHDYAAKGSIRLIKGRLKFGGQSNSAPFPSAVVIFDNTEPKTINHINQHKVHIMSAKDKAKKASKQFVVEINQEELATRLMEIGCHVKRPIGMTGDEAWKTFVEKADSGEVPAYIVQDFYDMAGAAIKYFGEQIDNLQQTN